MTKRHRIFIAINLPSEIKKALAGYKEKFSDLPAKWTPPENLHITLLFLGYVTDVELGDVCMAVKEVTARHQTVDIALNAVAYGPDNKIPPRILWASGEKSKALSALKNDLEEALLEKVYFVPENKGFAPHVTLAKISAFSWRQIEPAERPEVNEIIDLVFTAESIEVMESELKRGGPKYTIIESMPLSA